MIKTIVLTSFFLSLPALANGFDLIGGKYGSYTFTCGYDVEKAGNQLYLTGIRNKLLSATECGVAGEVIVMDCTPKGSNTCSINASKSAPNKCPSYYLEILDDGNFVAYNPCRTDEKWIIKYIR